MKIETTISPEHAALMLAILVEKYGDNGKINLERAVYDRMPESVALVATAIEDDIFELSIVEVKEDE